MAGGGVTRPKKRWWKSDDVVEHIGKGGSKQPTAEMTISNLTWMEETSHRIDSE